MITIDAQIWVYYFDANALENANVTKWLVGEDNNGTLFTEEILLSLIIPMEVGHSIFKTRGLMLEDADQIMNAFLSIDTCRFIDIDLFLATNALKFLRNNASTGIGGRDALIVATMNEYHVTTIVTNDKNLLSLKDYKRIDPVLDPPIILDIGEEFDQKIFKTRISKLYLSEDIK